MRAYSNPYFPLYGQNHIRVFPHMDRVVDGKISIRGNQSFDIRGLDDDFEQIFTFKMLEVLDEINNLSP